MNTIAENPPKSQPVLERVLTFSFGRTVLWVLVCGACYYLASKIAWKLTLPNSVVSLLFPPLAVLVSALLLAPTRHWWAYTLAAMGGHFLAAMQAHWTASYALKSEAYDIVQIVLTAAGIRLLVKSSWNRITLREAIYFVLVAAVIVPFGAAFLGAAVAVSKNTGVHYWSEWRTLGVSNGVTGIVLVPAILLGVSHWSDRQTKTTPGRLVEAGLLGACILAVGHLAFDELPAGPDTQPALLYAPMPLLIWAALRFGLGGICASTVAIAFLAIWGAMHGRGPFLLQTPTENAFALQLFLLVTAIPLMFLAVVIDEERHSQDAVRESEERFRTMADTAPVMIWMSGPDKRCTYFNRRWLDFTGRPHEAEVGDGWIANVHPEDVGSRVAGYREAFDSREPFTVEYRLRRHDGQYRWILAQAVPRLTASGEFLGYVGSCLDVTDRKRIEETNANLAHAQRLAVVGELTAMVAHEVNQPLGAILSNADAAEMLLESANPPLDKISEILADIRKNDLRADEAIRRIRALLRKREMQTEPLDLNEAVSDVLQLVTGDAARRRVQVRRELAPELPPAFADRVHLQHVLLNLVVNGMDSMNDISEVSRRLTVQTRLDGDDFLEVAVADCGCGFAPERLPRIFDSFFTTKKEGTGLGLTIARSIIEAHQGRIWAENNSGGGATFHFTVKVAKDAR